MVVDIAMASLVHLWLIELMREVNLLIATKEDILLVFNQIINPQPKKRFPQCIIFGRKLLSRPGIVCHNIGVLIEGFNTIRFLDIRD